MVTLKDLLNTVSFTDVALSLANKVAFNRDKAISVWSQTYWDFARDIHNHLRIIESTIHDYRFRPNILQEKRVKFKVRKLYVSDWRDKIVEMWLNKTLNIVLAKSLSPSSYAYRSDRSVITCQSDATNAIKNSSFFIKRDIKDFYYTIDQDLMLEKLKQFVCEHDPLFNLLKQRVKFKYYDAERRTNQSQLGLPFGSAVACILANIFLDDVDKELAPQCDFYHRYADDFLLCGSDPERMKAISHRLDNTIAERKLQFGIKKSFDYSFVDHPDYTKVNRLAYLGMEFWHNGIVRLPIEKRRKIINIVKATIASMHYRLKRSSPKRRATMLCEAITNNLKTRIRYAAIVDYFLHNTNDEEQLKSMDRQISELVIAAATGKKFRPSHYKIIPYKFLRKVGLISLLHRSRLLRSKEMSFSFLSLFDKLSVNAILKSIQRRKDRVEEFRARKRAK